MHAALGATRAGAFDLNAGCTGFVYALAQANALVDASAARRVVVCGTDVMTRVADYGDARSCVLFGDGAGAAIVERVEGPSRIGPFVWHTDGSQPHLLYIPPDTGLIRMEGREVYRRAVDGMTRAVKEILGATSMSIDDVDLLVAHQANARILEAVGERLGLRREQVSSNIARLGNTSAASIPLALADEEAAGRLNEGDVVVLAAFGAGFLCGAGIVRWGSRIDQAGALAAAGRAHG